MRTVSEPKFNTSKPQKWSDPWRGGTARVMRFCGKCVCCGRRTYAFDDGQNDPRGVLGDHAASPLVASDYESTGDDIPACFACMNEEPSYRHALAIARTRWTPAGYHFLGFATDAEANADVARAAIAKAEGDES